MNSHLDWFSVTYVLWRHHVKHFAFLFFMKQINSMLPRVCSVIDNRRLRNKAKKFSGTLGCASYPTLLFLPHLTTSAVDN